MGEPETGSLKQNQLLEGSCRFLPPADVIMSCSRIEEILVQLKSTELWYYEDPSSFSPRK